MPDADTQPQAATAVADPPATSSPESTAPAASPQVGSATSFDAIFAQALAGIPKDDPTETALSGTTKPADPAPAVTQDAKPTPDAGVTASDETTGEGDESPPEPGKPLSRRQQIAAEKDAEIARLSALVAERDPEAIKATLREQVRAELEAETTRKANESVDEDFLGNQQRFEHLLTVPDAEISAEDYQWREDRKERRRLYAPVERHYRSIYEQKLAEARAGDQPALAAMREQDRATIGAQIATLASLDGVDSSTWTEQGKSFADYGQSLYEGGRAAASKELLGRVEKAEAETARLTKANQDLQLQLRDGTPAPAVAGRSVGSSTKPTADPKGSFEDNLSAAFGWSG